MGEVEEFGVQGRLRGFRGLGISVWSFIRVEGLGVFWHMGVGRGSISGAQRNTKYKVLGVYHPLFVGNSHVDWCAWRIGFHASMP